MQIQVTIHQILDQLNSILSQLDDYKYTKELPILNNQTIGKHSRHIIEFFQGLTNTQNYICYDERIRDLKLETSIEYTLNTLDIIKTKIEDLDFEQKIEFKQLINTNLFTTETTIGREMIYCIDHGIHHFAIIKIALKDSFPSININEDFGIAYSTLNFQKNK